MLSGKYLDNARPAKSRLALFARFHRYTNAEGEAATREYVQLARRFSMQPAALALSFIASQPFVSSIIIGQTTMEQLRANIDAAQTRLRDDVLAEIEKIHRRHTIPCP